MSVDRVNRIIEFPIPKIEPVSDTLREAMDLKLRCPKLFLPDITHESIVDLTQQTTFRSLFNLRWHSDNDVVDDYTVMLAASSTPPYIAAAKVNYQNIPDYSLNALESQPAQTLYHWLGHYWVEDAFKNKGLSRSCLDVEVTFLEQLDPYYSATGNSGDLLHRSAEVVPGSPLVRSFYRKFTVVS